MSLSGWQLDATDPLWLLGLGGLLLLAWWFRRSLVDSPRRQRVLSLACRTLIVILLVGALAGLTLRRPSQDLFVVFAIDRSESVGDDAARFVDRYLDDALAHQGGARVAFLPFAVEPGTAASDRRAGTAPPTGEGARMGTDLAAAIEAAAGPIPPGFAQLSSASPTAPPSNSTRITALSSPSVRPACACVPICA